MSNAENVLVAAVKLALSQPVNVMNTKLNAQFDTHIVHMD